METLYHIRPARVGEEARILEIEDEAGLMFAGLGLIDDELDESFPPEETRRLIEAGQVWVACLPNDTPAGFVIVTLREGAAFVEEMDVLPAHGRRGLATRLLDAVAEWAREQGLAAVTLSTFRDVPWNGPFYLSRGFRILDPGEWTPGMREIHHEETEHGLAPEHRVFMRRDLRPGR